MLAVFLHPKLHPPLGAGSVVLPIVSPQMIHNPIILKMLSKSSGIKREQIRFITLVKLPDDLPVAVVESADYSNKTLNYFPISRLPEEVRIALRLWSEALQAGRHQDLPLLYLPWEKH